MAEGQTRLMQQVSESESWDAVDWLRIAAEQTSATRGFHRDSIRRAVQTEILPRLSAGHVSADKTEPTDSEAVRVLVGLLLQPDHATEVTILVDAAMDRGMAVEQVCLRLFQPAARCLGDLWNDDLCSFVDVTLAMATLQTLLRRLAPSLNRGGRPVDGTRSVLLTTLPGEQHTFGVNMAAEFFRQNGWNVCTIPWHDASALANTLQADGYAVVGFSMSRRERLDELAAAIQRVRRACKKGPVGILVGGPLFAEHPEHAIRVGGDAVGVDAPQALAHAESFVTGIKHR